MLPPPNVTGTLHMGHAFQDTIMDALTREHRMRGEPHCGSPVPTTPASRPRWWSNGSSRRRAERRTDLGARGIRRTGVGLEGAIRRHDRAADAPPGRLGRLVARALHDGSGLSAAVTEAFVRLHEEGLIYRGKRLVNWDPVLQTALSDLEVQSEEEDGQLWHLRYPLVGGAGTCRRDHPPRDACSGIPRWRSTPRTSAIAHLIGRRCGCRSRTRDSDHRRRLRRSGLRHGLRQDHARPTISTTMRSGSATVCR